MPKFTCGKCGANNGGKSKHKPFTVGMNKIVCCGHCGCIRNVQKEVK